MRGGFGIKGTRGSQGSLGGRGTRGACGRMGLVSVALPEVRHEERATAFTLTKNEVVVETPYASLALQVTLVLPIGKKDPGSGVQSAAVEVPFFIYIGGI